MSYVVSITRPQGDPITREDLAALMKMDASLSLIDETNLVWSRPDGRMFYIRIESGSLWTDEKLVDQDLLLGKLQGIARALGARVAGEDAEDLTRPVVSRGSQMGAIVGLVTTLATIPILLVAMVVRLPYLVWRFTRLGK